MTREEAIKLIDTHTVCFYNEIDSQTLQALHRAIEALSAETVSREEYEETDGVVKIKKQSANDVGEIKHIVVCSPNFTRYFYNESMPISSAEAVQCEWIVYGKPKEGQYLVTLDAWGHRFIDIMHYDKPQMPNIEVDGACWYRVDDEFGDVVYDDKDILAWMPLPEPYKERGEE